MIIKHQDGCTPARQCAVCEAARFLRTKLSSADFAHFVGILEGTGTDLFDKSINDVFDFGVRTANCLSNAKIQTVRQLLSLNDAEFLRLPNMGRRSLNEVKESLGEKGLRFAQLA